MANGKDNWIVTGIVGGFIILTVTTILIARSRSFHYNKNSKWAKDKDSVKKVSELHPKVRNRVAKVLTEIEKKTGYVVDVTSGFRSTDLQSALSHDNPKNAKAGLSDHEYGFAVDINATKNGKRLVKASSRQTWIDSGIPKIFKDNGFKWGGDFKTYHDPIHFFDDFGIKPEKMATMPKDKQGYIKL